MSHWPTGPTRPVGPKCNRSYRRSGRWQFVNLCYNYSMDYMVRSNNGRFIAKSFVNEDFFLKMTHELAWVLGLLASDGHIVKSGNRVVLSQSGEVGLEMVENFARLVGWTGTIARRKTKGQDAHEVRFTSSSACDA